MGRRTFEPTAEQRNMVRRMAMAGVQREIMAQCVINPETEKPITPKTLNLRFKQELEVGCAKADAAVVAALYRAATSATSGPQVAAAIFWCKTKLGWGGTIAFEGTVKTEPHADHLKNLELLPLEDQRQILEIIQRARAQLEDGGELM